MSTKRALERIHAEPVLVGYYCCQSRGVMETTASWDDFDESVLREIEDAAWPAELWYPTDELPNGYNTRQPKPYGITRVDAFYTRRNLWAMSMLWKDISEVADDRLRHKLAFAFTGLYLRVTRFAEFRFLGGSSNSPRLYVPYVSNEQNVFVTYMRKCKAIADHLRTARFHEEPSLRIGVQSASDLRPLADQSVDYCFTDPPFGGNINYSEMNFLWESWLRSFTNPTDEAVINSFQSKDVGAYGELLRDAFREVRRVLRRDGRFSVVFSSSSADVWAAIVNALHDAGFEVDTALVLDKRHPSLKQLTAENVAGMDLVITARPTSVSAAVAPLRTLTTDETRALVREVAAKLGPSDMRSLFAYAIAEGLRNGSLMGIDFKAFRRLVGAEFPEFVVDTFRPYSTEELRRRLAQVDTQQSFDFAERSS